VGGAGAAAEIGIIGGSGLYQLGLLDTPDPSRVSTPFGAPSGPLVLGTLGPRRVAFLARHGEGHVLTPSEIPVRANLYALRSAGVRRVLAVSAVGSLSEKYAPGDLVVPDQIVDRTTGARPASFFGDGLVVHVSLADPFCPTLRGALLAAAQTIEGAVVHDGATYCCIEGPRFSTRAESELYRSWGMGVVGMTAMPEAALAREAELCYASLALVTDYDCWHVSEEPVTADRVAEIMQHNVSLAAKVLAATMDLVDPEADCECRHALDAAVLTAPRRLEPAVRERLELLLGGRFPPPAGEMR
jgi:5'-methylthioadenosine phosphorylase